MVSSDQLHCIAFTLLLPYFLSPRLSNGDIVNGSVRLSRYLLLNHWAEFNQICYMTSLRSRSEREQNYVSLCPMWP